MYLVLNIEEWKFLPCIRFKFLNIALYLIRFRIFPLKNFNTMNNNVNTRCALRAEPHCYYNRLD